LLIELNLGKQYMNNAEHLRMKQLAVSLNSYQQRDW